MTSAESQRASLNVWDCVLPAVAIVLLAWACAMEFILPASHDELHFAHAAWLWSQGKEPYYDFLYHNTPGVIYLLGAAQLVFGNFGPEVLWWGRAWCAVSLLTVACFMLAIGHTVHSRRAGWIAVILFVPGTVIPYASDLLLKHNFMIRPEIFAMPLMTAAVWLGFLAIKYPNSWATVRNGVLMSSLVAIVLFLSPRMMFTVAGLGVALAVGLERRIGPIVLGSLVGLGGLVALYGGLIGWENSWTWVYKYSKLLLHQSTDGLAAFTKEWIRRNPAWPIVVIAPLVALYAALNSRDRMMQCLAWMVLAMYSNLLVEENFTFASWQGHVVFGSVLLGSAGYTLFSQLSPALRAAIVLVGVAIIGQPLVRFRHSTRVLTCWRCQLAGQIAAYDRVCAATRGEPVMFQQKYHPIAVDDGTYLWTQREVSREIMSMLGVPERKLDILQDVRERPPVILCPEELRYRAQTSADPQWLDRFVSENYRKTDHDFTVRKDRFDDLAPLLEEFDVRMHLSIVRKE